VVSDVPVDDEALVVTSRISRFTGAQSFGGARRGRVCVRVFIGVSVRECVVLCESKKIHYMQFSIANVTHETRTITVNQNPLIISGAAMSQIFFKKNK
jgi:hypothetical protein